LQVKRDITSAVTAVFVIFIFASQGECGLYFIFKDFCQVEIQIPSCRKHCGVEVGIIGFGPGAGDG
jgi:hypothetical protein